MEVCLYTEIIRYHSPSNLIHKVQIIPAHLRKYLHGHFNFFFIKMDGCTDSILSLSTYHSMFQTQSNLAPYSWDYTNVLVFCGLAPTMPLSMMPSLYMNQVGYTVHVKIIQKIQADSVFFWQQQ